MVTILKTGERINGASGALRRRVSNLNTAKNNHGRIEAEYRKLFELSPVGIIVMDMNGVVKSCSPAVYRETGCSEEEYIGRHFKEGLEFPVQMSTSLVRDAVGNLMGMVRIGRELGKLES